jgi:hypothetical protein
VKVLLLFVVQSRRLATMGLGDRFLRKSGSVD